MKLAIMQPYFLPYLGYWQLLASVDTFILYDNIKYTKKGWINRNRMLLNGKDEMFSLPLKKDSDYLDVRDRELAGDFNPDKLLNQFRGAYLRAPHFQETYPLLEQILRYEDRNLFRFIHHSIVRICERLDIATRIVISSEIRIDPDLKGQDKVLALCEAVGAKVYINAIGGQELYSREVFGSRGIELKFIHSKPIEYVQFGNEFIPWLSILDVMMFNANDVLQKYIATYYELIECTGEQ
jgi:hypothetical protein